MPHPARRPGLLLALTLLVGALLQAAPPAIATADDDSDFRQAVVDAYKLLDQEQYERAELAFIEMTRKWPGEGEGWYHLACCYSRWSKTLEGAEHDEKLELAQQHLLSAAKAAKVYRDLANMTNDPDMEPLRDTDAYRSAMDLIRRRLAGPRAVDARALEYRVYTPGDLKDRPMLVWCHETGSNAETALKQVTSVCRERNWVLVALQGPEATAMGANGQGRGWSTWSELGVLKTIQNLKADRTLGPRIRRDRVLVGGYRQGAYVALCAAMVEPDSIHTALLVDAPLDTRSFPLDRIKQLAGKVRIYDAHSTSDLLGLPGARSGIQRFADAGVTARLHECDAVDLPPYLANWLARDFDHWWPTVE
ncbi:MAG: hypothetical protein AB7K09_03555 [Planctomycetota bacterium]